MEHSDIEFIAPFAKRNAVSHSDLSLPLAGPLSMLKKR
jgi:hypothetical protein